MISQLHIASESDRDKLKIASFRTKEGIWADFTAAANAIGLTATDVLKAAIEQFIAGDYSPATNPTVRKRSITREEVEDLISELRSQIDRDINTIVNTVSIQSNRDINTALVPMQDQIDRLKVAIVDRATQPDRSKIRVTKPKQQQPQPLEAMTNREVCKNSGLSRQSIERYRDSGTLSKLGYRADRIDGKWWYFPLSK